MPRSVLTCLLIFALTIAASPVKAQQKLDIVQIMGQFVQANHAASKCLKPDGETLARFLHNFKIVTIRASEEVRKRNPALSDQQIGENFKKGQEAVAKQIDAVLAVSGCSDPRIQDLLKRFEIQANLKL